MKTIHLLLLTLTSLMTAAFGATLKPGDAVPLEALRDCTFLQGEAPEAWEPGKLYLIECWFTTCGPCVAVMPHLQELHAKLKDKGLGVTAVSIYDVHPERVKAFMNDRPGLMTYPVAYAEENGSFIKDWVMPMGVNSAPQSILVRDGKLLCRTDPRQLNEEGLSKLMKGGAASIEIVKKLEEGVEEKTQPTSQEEEINEKLALVGTFFESLSKRADTLLEGKSIENLDEKRYLAAVDQILASRKDLSDDDRLALLFPKWITLLKQNNPVVAQEVLFQALRLSPATQPPLPLEILFLMPRVVAESAPGMDPAQKIREALWKTGRGFGANLLPGCEVSLTALKACEFIQGSAPATWEPGALYLIECWSTTCGPCIKAVPHVNELHTQFKDQGLRVIGVSLWEDKIEPVKEFVKKSSSQMAFPVAYAGEDSLFMKQWVEAAKIFFIPMSILVRDGRIIALSKPQELTKKIVGELLAGGERSAAAERTLRGNADAEEK